MPVFAKTIAAISVVSFITLLTGIGGCGGGGGSGDTLAPRGPLSSPKVIEPEDGCPHAGPSPNFDWEVENAKTHRIYWSKERSEVQASLGHEATTSQSWFRPGELEENTTYYWKVVSANELSNTESSIWSFTTCQRQYYLDGKNGDDGNDGTSESRAVRSLSRAMELAQSGCTLHVAEAVYSGELNRNIDLGTRWIEVIGEGSSQNTIIDCEEAGRAFEIGYAARPRFISLTFRNGRTSQYGGAVLCRDGSPTFIDCHFESCTSSKGGALAFLAWGSPHLVDCHFQFCSASLGGAIFVEGEVQAIVEACRVSSCNAASGGGIFSKDLADLTCRNCLFENCTANSDEVF